MGRRSLILLALLLVAFPASASAAPVLELGPGGHVSTRNNPFLAATPFTPAPAGAASSTAGPAAIQAAAKAPRESPRGRTPTVTGTLGRLLRADAITASAYQSYMGSVRSAVGAANHLRGTRARELNAVIDNLKVFAAAHELTPSRLPVLFLTLNRNRQWWTSGTIPSTWERIQFSGSNLIWQYYPGQGIELQVLGTFGEADGMYTAGPQDYPELESLLAEMIPLAVVRGGGLAWEYYFQFDGGVPPWTSAMSQGTGIEALTRAYEATHQSSYLTLAHQALGIFQVPPPAGVAEPTSHGTRYLQYSFTPHTYIINAFLQSLIGLYDYAQASNDPVAQRLFAAGDAEALSEVPSYDTGAWSLYQPGVEDDLSYHELVTGFLQQLCSRTEAPVYCTAAQHFTSYLTTPPVLTQLTQSTRRRRSFDLSFQLSKYSHVGVVVMRGAKTVFLTSASFAYGVEHFYVPALRAGTYTVRLAATDLAGNFSRITGTLKVR